MRPTPPYTSVLPNSKMIHDLDIDKWPNITFTKWLALVDQTPALEWNHMVVDPAKVSAGLTKLAASSLAGTAITMQKL